MSEIGGSNNDLAHKNGPFAQFNTGYSTSPVKAETPTSPSISTMPQNVDTVNLSTKNDEQNNKKKKALKIVAAIVVTAAAIAGIVYCVKTGKLKKIKPVDKLANEAKTLAGNNNVLDDVVGKSNKVVDEMIQKNPKEYESFLTGLKDQIKPCDVSKLPEGGIVYHGTSKETAKMITETGITPFVKGSHGAELGKAVYTTGNPDVAKMFSQDGGIILPFKLSSDKIAEVKQENFQAMVEKVAVFCDDFTHTTNYEKIMGKPCKKPDTSLILRMLNPDENVVKSFTNRAFRDLGYDAAYSSSTLESKSLIDVAALNPFFKKMAETEKETGILQSQFAIFDASKLALLPELMGRIN